MVRCAAGRQDPEHSRYLTPYGRVDGWNGVHTKYPTRGSRRLRLLFIGKTTSRITEGRRLRRQRALTALAGAAVVALGVGVIMSVLQTGDADPAPPVTDVTTTVIDGTTVPTNLPGQVPLPDLGVGTVVIADPGASTAGTDGAVLVDADTAIGNGSSGLVVQRDNAILQVGADGTETGLLDATDLMAEFGPVSLRLQDVASLDGAPQAIAVVSYGEQYPDVFEEVWFLNLDSGATESVYRMVAVESTITRVSVAGGTTVLSVSFEGGTYFEYLDSAGQPVDAAGPYDGGLPGGVPDFPIAIDQGVLSPDGTRLAYIEIDVTMGFEAGASLDLVIWDLINGTEQQRLGIELGDGAWPGRLDYDGLGVVLGREQRDLNVPLTPLQVTSLDSGIVTELGTAGRPSLIK